MGWFDKKVPPIPPETPKTAPTAGKPAKGLKVSPLLSEEVVLLPGDGMDKNAVLDRLAAAVCRKAGLPDHLPYLGKVLEREGGISTTLDTGLSLPHARLDGIPGIMAGLAVLKKPVPDPKQTDLSIRVMFLFFSPNRPDAFPLHLQLLRGVSSLFQPAAIDQLTAAPTPAAVLELVRKLEA
ncbi:MAG: PTS sugar transporter subunit IIA [Elusimicrobiota bacterium]|nr:PTS sugar transporter subunit IIA [Elusimicrobiota bacterium]